MQKNYKIGIIGLGYVGLPLVLAFSKYFKVVGFDINPLRVESLKKSIDTNCDQKNTINDNINYSSQISDLSKCNIYIVTVPTPVSLNNVPDLSILEKATKMISPLINKNDIIIYESTVYPGVTEEICIPKLEEFSNMKHNKDFFCAYSPERISPGNEKYSLENVIKVVSACNEKVLDEVVLLYDKIIDAGVFKAPSIKVAEASKVIENIQRDVNIALMNELAMMFDKMDIETSQVLETAKTKWNFLDFKPGLVGGHCIGVDPYYLLHKSIESGYQPNLLSISREINNKIPKFIVKKTIDMLNKFDKNIKDSNILILGYTFKENCSDIRNTKVKDIVLGLESFYAKVDIYDPYLKNNNNNFISNPFLLEKKYDAILVAVAHNEFLNYTNNDFNQISKGKLVFLDIKGIYKESKWKL